MHQIEPLYDRVVVKREDAPDKSEGGLYIPDTAKEKPQEGIVVSVGCGRYDEWGHLQPMLVSPGQRVLFGRYAGSEFWVDDECYLVMREEEIIGVIREGKEELCSAPS
jgi:chaperonin GroES